VKKQKYYLDWHPCYALLPLLIFENLRLQSNVSKFGKHIGVLAAKSFLGNGILSNRST
jgi:hypothetical protein